MTLRVRVGNGLCKSLYPTWSLFGGRHPVPIDQFDKSVRHELPEPKEPRVEIHAPKHTRTRVGYEGDANTPGPLLRIRKARFFSWRTRFDASAALPTCTGNINTSIVVGSAATGLCAKTP